MTLVIEASIEWIGPEFGGNPHPPVVGLRPTVRFQRNVGAWLKAAWGAEIEGVDLDANTWRGTATLAFSQYASQSMEIPKAGELIELLDSYRVIGVGKILSISQIGAA